MLMQQKRKIMTSNKEVEQLQIRYQELIDRGKVTKADICQLVIPFRDKYGLTDIQALSIARADLTPTQINKLLTKCIINNTRTVTPYQIVCDNLTLNFWWYRLSDNKVMVALQIFEYDLNRGITFSLSQLKKGYSTLKWLGEIVTLDSDDYKEIKDAILKEVVTSKQYCLN